MPFSIYECEGARTCAIEFRSFSKNAGFTGVRLGFTVIPKDLKGGDVSLHALWARRHGTKYNGAPYIVQRAGEAVYSAAGKAQLKEQVAYYMNNAQYILKGLQEAGFTVSGGVMTGVNYAGSRLMNMTGIMADVQEQPQAATEAQETAPNTMPGSGNTTTVSTVTDVSAIVEKAMPSIVAITDTMTIQQRDFFGRTQAYQTQSSGSALL